MKEPDALCIGYVAGAELGLARIERPPSALATATLHGFLDDFLAGQGGAELDYIHGDGTLIELAAQPNRTGFLLPAMDKHDLFAIVRDRGPTPRKTFSLGEAHEKRYYLECRRIA